MPSLLPVKEGRHVQARLSPVEYERLKRAAAQEGVSIQDALRFAAQHWALDVLGEPHPLLRYAGFIKGGPADLAENVDDIYLED